jgi:orc1/cdc6 family replication initiation protein
VENSQAEEMYNNLFEPKNSIFKEEKILSKSYVPKNIIGRNTELEQVAANLAPIPRHGDPINMYIWGDSGVGKTITIQYVLSILEYGLSTNNHNSMVDFIRIDSMSTNNDIFACIEILSHLTATVPKMGLSISQYLQSIWNEIDLKARNYDFYALIIFFDEIDKFKDPNNILYQLSRSTENRKIKASNATIGIITASNKKDFLNSLDSKVLSSAGFTYLHFPDYSEEELCLILNSRIEAFQPGAISEEEIRYCAQNVADRFHGDARRAIDTLHIAGKIALNQHCKRITKEHIDLADKEITNTATLEMIVKFSKHDKLLIIAIYLCHQIILSEKLRSLPTTGVISQVYRMICEILGESPTSEGHISRRLTDLDDKQLIHAKKVKGSGNTRYISLSSDIEYVIDSIYTTILKAQIEASFCDIESYVIAGVKLNRRNVEFSEFI